MNRAVMRNPCEELEKMAEIFAALGSLTRLRILLLQEPGRELSIGDIAGQFTLGRTTVVHHIAMLEQSGLLRARREGRRRLHHTDYAALRKILQNLDACCARLQEPDNKGETP